MASDSSHGRHDTRPHLHTFRSTGMVGRGGAGGRQLAFTACIATRCHARTAASRLLGSYKHTLLGSRTNKAPDSRCTCVADAVHSGEMTALCPRRRSPAQREGVQHRAQDVQQLSNVNQPVSQGRLPAHQLQLAAAAAAAAAARSGGSNSLGTAAAAILACRGCPCRISRALRMGRRVAWLQRAAAALAEGGKRAVHLLGPALRG